MFCTFIQHDGFIECTNCGRTLRRTGTHYMRTCRMDSEAAEQPGLGDRVESALAFIGITKDRVEAWIGEPCNCDERREKLNALGEWAASAADRGKEWGLARLREIGAIEW